MNEPSLEDLARYRVLIDDLDRRILDLLNQRTAIVHDIGRVKQHLKLAIYEPKREDQVFANVLANNNGPLPPDSAKRVFERIIDEMRTVQQIDTLSPEQPASKKQSC